MYANTKFEMILQVLIVFVGLFGPALLPLLD